MKGHLQKFVDTITYRFTVYFSLHKCIFYWLCKVIFNQQTQWRLKLTMYKSLLQNLSSLDTQDSFHVCEQRILSEVSKRHPDFNIFRTIVKSGLRKFHKGGKNYSRVLYFLASKDFLK